MISVWKSEFNSASNSLDTAVFASEVPVEAGPGDRLSFTEFDVHPKNKEKLRAIQRNRAKYLE